MNNSSNSATVSTTGVANTQTGNQTAGLMGAFTPILLMIVFFYFLIVRPQQKREAKRRSLIDSAKKGDRVVTSSGIIGVVHKIVNNDEVSLEIAENVRIRVLKNCIANILDNKSSLGKSTENEEEKTESKKAKKKSTTVAKEKTVSEKKASVEGETSEMQEAK